MLLSKSLKVSHLGLAAPRSGVPSVGRQQVSKDGGLGTAQLVLCRLDPIGQGGDFFANIPFPAGKRARVTVFGFRVRPSARCKKFCDCIEKFIG